MSIYSTFSFMMIFLTISWLFFQGNFCTIMAGNYKLIWDNSYATFFKKVCRMFNSLQYAQNFAKTFYPSSLSISNTSIFLLTGDVLHIWQLVLPTCLLVCHPITLLQKLTTIPISDLNPLTFYSVLFRRIGAAVQGGLYTSSCGAIGP